MPIGRSAGDVYVEGHYRNAASFGREFSRQVQGPAERAAAEASHHFGRKFAAGLAIGGALIGAGLVKATRAAARGIQVATDKASDLNETINKTNVIFGKNAAEIQKWSRGSARSMGLSRQEALANASAFGDMFLQLKIGQPQAVNMSKRMVELAADFASFSNADISDVLLAQQSAFRGEYDALQRFVPGINAARVEQEALRETHKASAKDLTLAEKAQATYNIMLKDGKRATGDFARTADQLANTRRIEKAQIEDLQAAIGKRFLPAQLALHRALSDKLLPALGVLVKTYGPGVERVLTRWATGFGRAIPSSKQLTLGLRALGEAFRGNGITESSDSFVGKMERIGVAARKVVDWFSQLRPQFSGVGRSASQLGPALASAGGGGHVLANGLTIVAPVLEAVARNIHNVIPWLPVLLTGFLAFRAVRTVLGPIGDLGQAIAHFVSPATALATFMNARANKALAAALSERSIASAAAVRGDVALTASTTAAGNAAQGAAGKFALFGGGLRGVLASLGLFAAAAAAGAYQGKQLADATTKGTVVSGPFADVRARILRTLGLEATAARDVATAQRGLATATATGATASDRHAGALRSERIAIDALKGALQGEEVAELDVKQAKINVATAQGRLTELTKAGKRGSVEYRQAQLDLRRAQIDLRQRTDDYRIAQRTANAATGGAMRASQQATPAVRNLGEAARVGGGKAGGARIPWRKLGEDVSAAYREIHSQSVKITANFGWQGLKVFRTPGGALAQAKGGRITRGTTGTADDVPAWLSKGETVVPARASEDPGFQSWAAAKGIPGFALGGRIPTFGMRKADGFVKAFGDWDLQVEKVLDLATSRAKKIAERSFGGLGTGAGPGGWRWQMAVLRSAFPGLQLISGFRPGAITATGNVSYHAKGRAVDVPPRMDVFNWIRGMFGKRTRELIFSPAGNRQIWNGQPHMFTGITRANHWDHVHWAYRNGGRVREDVLGVGRSGDTYSFHRGEQVTPPNQPVVATLDPASVRAVAREFAAIMQATPMRAYMNPNDARAGIRESQRRGGIPAAQHVR